MIDILDEQGQLVPDAEIKLTAKVEGAAYLAGFGSGNPITDEDYTDNQTVSYRGHACAVLRSGYDKGKTSLTISAPGMEDKTITLE
jgi:beta-galactosidase